MPNERIKQPKLCSNCVNRLICPVSGRACAGHNSTQVFKSLLKQYAPTTDWDALLSEIKELRKLNRGYRSNE